MKRTVLIFVAIYLVTFGIIAGYNLTHPIVNDGVNEYIEYNRNIANGWDYRDSIVNSCVVTTWIPAMIHKITGFDKLILFKIFPAFLFSLMPAFTFLIARRYTRLSYAIIAAFVVIFSSTILYFPAVGRVGVALGFMAGLLWALLEKRYVWAGLFALAVVFSHYGASVIITGIVGLAALILLLRHQFEYKIALVAILLLALTVIWHGHVASFSGSAMTRTVAEGVEGVTVNEFLNIESREEVIQEALGLHVTRMNIPQVVELFMNWVVWIAITVGTFILLKGKLLDLKMKIFTLSAYGLIIFTALIPWLSVYYGAQRVYFTGMMVLGTGFPVCIDWLMKHGHKKTIIISCVILGLFAASTSGLIYLPFGEDKSFRIYQVISGS